INKIGKRRMNGFAPLHLSKEGYTTKWVYWIKFPGWALSLSLSKLVLDQVSHWEFEDREKGKKDSLKTHRHEFYRQHDMTVALHLFCKTECASLLITIILFLSLHYLPTYVCILTYDLSFCMTDLTEEIKTVKFLLNLKWKFRGGNMYYFLQYFLHVKDYIFCTSYYFY